MINFEPQESIKTYTQTHEPGTCYFCHEPLGDNWDVMVIGGGRGKNGVYSENLADVCGQCIAARTKTGTETG